MLTLVRDTSTEGLRPKAIERAMLYTVPPKALGPAFSKLATPEDVVRMGFNPKTGKFAFIVAKDFDTSVVTEKLPNGFLDIAMIQSVAYKVAAIEIIGNIAKFARDPQFLLGMQSMVAHGCVPPIKGITLRHDTTAATDCSVFIARLDVDYQVLSDDAINEMVVQLVTPDGKKILLSTRLNGFGYFATIDSIYVTPRKTTREIVETVINNNGIVACKRYDGIEFGVDNAPVTIMATDTAIIVGTEAGANWAFSVHKDTGEIVQQEMQRMGIGALISYAESTVLFDNGRVMSRIQISDIPESFRKIAGLTVPSTTQIAPAN